MKRILIVAMILMTLLTACQFGKSGNSKQDKKESFVLNATNLPSEYNDQYAYIIDDDEVFADSVLITNRAFTLTFDSIFTQR